jgi:hypothetical protein
MAKYAGRGSRAMTAARYCKQSGRATDATGIRQRWQKKLNLYAVRQRLAPLRAKRRNFPLPPLPAVLSGSPSLGAVQHRSLVAPPQAARHRRPNSHRSCCHSRRRSARVAGLRPRREWKNGGERERERGRERFFPSACCPREAIRRGKEKKRKNRKREKDREKIKMNYLFIKLLFINYINYIIIV